MLAFRRGAPSDLQVDAEVTTPIAIDQFRQDACQGVIAVGGCERNPA